MLVQVNINQDIENNILYTKNVTSLLSSAIIKNALGEDMIIDWDTGEGERVETVMHELEKTVNVCMDKNIFEDEIDIDSYKEVGKTTRVVVNLEKITDMDVSEQVTYSTNNTSLIDNVGRNDEIGHIENTSMQQITNNKSNNTTKSLEENIKTYYGISTKEAFNMQLGVGGKIQKNGKWISATTNEMQQYFMPSEENIQKYKFQFLNLASLAGISEADAKVYLSNKGILSGQEATFIKAAKTNNINEIYLMAHACLETGNGTSKLATGVSYKGKVVYNMFGIGAVDSDPIGKGAQYAYNMGWTSPEKAIMGGAQFISQKYINNYPYNQDTLYEMRWNPASPGYHQYATDIAWATKQAVWMEKLYASFENATLTFDIPVYRK